MKKRSFMQFYSAKFELNMLLKIDLYVF